MVVVVVMADYPCDTCDLHWSIAYENLFEIQQEELCVYECNDVITNCAHDVNSHY